VKNAESGFMDGNWPPVKQEIDRAVCKVDGRIPVGLEGGLYLRTGPNPRCWPPSGRVHAFGPDAMIHRVSLEAAGNGTVQAVYSNSWIQPARQRACGPSGGAGDLLAGGLALPRMLILAAIATLVGVELPTTERTAAGSTSVVHQGGKLFAATESFLPFEIKLSREKLQPIGFTTIGGMLEQKVGPKEGTFSAHPRIDPATNQLYFFSANTGRGALPRLAFGVLHANGSADRFFHMPVPSPTTAFYHDMLLTEHWAIAVDSSLRRDSSRLLSGKSLTFFNSSYNMRFGVLSRNAVGPEEMVWLECDGPAHIWHTVSAWEETGQKVVVWAPKFESYSDDVPIHLPREEPSYLTKFTLDLVSLSVKEEKFLSVGVVERPSTSPRVSPRIVYLRSEGSVSGEMGGELVKFHLGRQEVLGRTQCGEEEDRCIFGEALFVPDQVEGGGEEDEGWLMDFVYFPSNHSSAWFVWDARDLTRVATVHLPQRVPYGVHGLWLDKQFLDSQDSRQQLSEID